MSDDINGAAGVSAVPASVPGALAIKAARKAIRGPVYQHADNIDRAVGSALYRQQHSEIARCFLRLVAAQAMSAREGQDAQQLGAEPASAVRQDAPEPLVQPTNTQEGET